VKFKLPDTLPATVEELDALIDTAQKDINVIQARAEAGEDLTLDDVDALNALIDAVETLNTAKDEAVAEAEDHATKVAEALNRAKTATTPPAAEEPEAESEIVAEAEAIVEEAAEPVAAAAKAPVTFAGAGPTDAPAVEEGPGWIMSPGAPGYREGKVGFKELGLALDSVTKGHGVGRRSKPSVGEYGRQSLATISRELKVIDDSHELVAEIERSTSFLPNGERVTAQSLTAAGGWCAPSEQIYTFCDVPEATDLISLPEIAIRRGGIRWPVEPDLSAIFTSFEFFFTEAQLEAVDAQGDPTAIKHCVEIPCPDQFEELRLNAVGYCVEAGILQRQGWPESIEWFLRSLAQEHMRALSRRTVNDMVAGSGSAIVIDKAGTLGTAGSVLNSIALMATNLRLDKGLSRTATIEGVAPSWLYEVIRADLAYQEGTDTFAVGDAQISGWLTARNIALQFVGDWQTRSAGKPGNLATKEWPATVDLLLYPAGTWFRSLQPVIEMGVMYPKEQLVVNRYTEFFTEDAIAVGKRCNKSILVTVPICVSGAVGARQTVACNTATP
jgi:hypothetical protein